LVTVLEDVSFILFLIFVKRDNHPPLDAQLGEQVADRSAIVQSDRGPPLCFGWEFVA